MAEVMVCDGVGHKICLASSLLSLEYSLRGKPASMSGGHSGSPMWRSVQGGTKASCQ